MTLPQQRRRARRSLVAAGSCFAALVLHGCGGDGPPTGVLLISIDSLRADHVSSYGYVSETNPDVETTPYLDRLMAEGGARFTKAYSTTSWTLPAHMALLTGQPNEIHGVTDAPAQLHEEQPYLASFFADAGWTTFGIWSGPNVHPYFGFDRGFDLFADCSAVAADVNAFAEAETTGISATHDRSHQAVTGPRIVDTFIEWYDGLAPDEKFFAFVHMWDVHYDYHAPEEYDVFYPNYGDGWVTGEKFKDLNAMFNDATPMPRKDLLRLKSLYDAEIRYTDANIQKMVSRLEDDGRLDTTLVVVVADHGEEFGEHGVYGHKYNLYEETVRIPIMMRLPGTIPAGYAVNGTTSIVDVAPTILDIAQVPGREQMWGRSTLSVFLDHVELRDRPAPLELTVRNQEWYRGARGADYKVIRVAPAQRENVRGAGRGDPRKFRYLEQYVDRYEPWITTGLYPLPKDATEGPRFAPVIPADLPQPVRELEQLRPIAVDTSHQKVRNARALWDSIDTVARQWSTRRKQGVLGADLIESLRAQGYIVDDPADAQGSGDAATESAPDQDSGSTPGDAGATGSGAGSGR
jgi:arylsulfatase